MSALVDPQGFQSRLKTPGLGLQLQPSKTSNFSSRYLEDRAARRAAWRTFLGRPVGVVPRAGAEDRSASPPQGRAGVCRPGPSGSLLFPGFPAPAADERTLLRGRGSAPPARPAACARLIDQVGFFRLIQEPVIHFHFRNFLPLNIDILYFRHTRPLPGLNPRALDFFFFFLLPESTAAPVGPPGPLL